MWLTLTNPISMWKGNTCAFLQKHISYYCHCYYVQLCFLLYLNWLIFHRFLVFSFFIAFFLISGTFFKPLFSCFFKFRVFPKYHVYFPCPLFHVISYLYFQGYFYLYISSRVSGIDCIVVPACISLSFSKCIAFLREVI